MAILDQTGRVAAAPDAICLIQQDSRQLAPEFLSVRGQERVLPRGGGLGGMGGGWWGVGGGGGCLSSP